MDTLKILALKQHLYNNVSVLISTPFQKIRECASLASNYLFAQINDRYISYIDQEESQLKSQIFEIILANLKPIFLNYERSFIVFESIGRRIGQTELILTHVSSNLIENTREDIRLQTLNLFRSFYRFQLELYPLTFAVNDRNETIQPDTFIKLGPIVLYEIYMHDLSSEFQEFAQATKNVITPYPEKDTWTIHFDRIFQILKGKLTKMIKYAITTAPQQDFTDPFHFSKLIVDFVHTYMFRYFLLTYLYPHDPFLTLLVNGAIFTQRLRAKLDEDIKQFKIFSADTKWIQWYNHMISKKYGLCK